MIARNRGADAYRRVDAQSRSPLELVVMLYDGLLAKLNEASAAQDRGDQRSKTRAVARALAILSELQNTLNMKAGGDVATELDRLYTYVGQRLLDVRVQGDASALAEVQRLITPVRDAWYQVSGQRIEKAS